MTKAHELARFGQSIWYDNIRRALIETGGLQQLINDGVMGVTSNPSIFDKAISGSADYDEAIQALAVDGKSVQEIYDVLTQDDIASAADLLRPIYDKTDGLDGYVSLEVSPTLARDTAGTIAEARRLFAALGRPNVMIKVPATAAGIPAIAALIGEGINVNVTLIFALENYEAVAEAYLAGLEAFGDNVSLGDLTRVASVASFFVSRVDAAVDDALPADSALRGKIAIANAKVAYGRFQQLFSGPRWEKLAECGARVQRPLWASTSAKNPAYSATMYVDGLIGPNTVNTVPPATLTTFQKQGSVAATLERGLAEAQMQLDSLVDLGIDLNAVTQKLQDDGVASFAQSFESLLAGLAEKRERLLARPSRMETKLGAYQPVVDKALAEMEADSIMARIWAGDHTVWKPEPTEISNRLGWLRIGATMQGEIGRMQALADNLKAEGYTDALLLGMGGSSMAPELFAKTFGAASDGLNLHVLDSTDADAVGAKAASLDVTKTVFIVATKSGGTVETLSFFKYFYNRVADQGVDKVGAHFVAITDPVSKLESLAARYDFRDTFLNDPNIGGRYS